MKKHLPFIQRLSLLGVLVFASPHSADAMNLVETFGELPTWVVAMLAIGVAVLLLSVLALFLGRQARAGRVRKYAKRFFRDLDDVKERLALLDKHSFDYLHGIPANLQSDYAHAKSLIGLGEQRRC